MWMFDQGYQQYRQEQIDQTIQEGLWRRLLSTPAPQPATTTASTVTRQAATCTCQPSPC